MKLRSRKELQRIYLELQNVVYDDCKPKQRKIIFDAMAALDAVMMDMRRKEIFAAGAAAKNPVPRFEGRDLGSFEACNFYDGYASTHPDFQNPYRRRNS